ncbi:plasmid replication, integration and excision activator [Kitasatospora sp. NPDC058965]|uniref:plasmid replication, integration and excision activator n=1 Tax=Kitasatospora sp. NPDC058965 TaxID=3346682 RepID=UPI0036765AF5
MGIRGAIPVRFEDVFPVGAFAVSVEPAADFEASKSGGRVQARDKATGQPLWVVSVVDPDPEARDTSARVKVAAAVLPVLPDPAPGFPFRPVEFEGLTVTPYVNGSGRVAYSFRASGVRVPAASRAAAKGAA